MIHPANTTRDTTSNAGPDTFCAADGEKITRRRPDAPVNVDFQPTGATDPPRPIYSTPRQLAEVAHQRSGSQGSTPYCLAVSHVTAHQSARDQRPAVRHDEEGKLEGQ